LDLQLAVGLGVQSSSSDTTLLRLNVCEMA
jgi:hypothetical protein